MMYPHENKAMTSHVWSSPYDEDEGHFRLCMIYPRCIARTDVVDLVNLSAQIWLIDQIHPEIDRSSSRESQIH